MSPKNGLGRRGRTSGVGNPPSGGLNGARKRGRKPERGSEAGLGSRRAAAYRIPARAPTRSPQGGAAAGGQESAAERREEPADLHAEGNAEAEASERQRASSTRSPAVDAAGVTAGRGMASPGAGRAQPRERLGSGRSGGGQPRATRSGARVSSGAAAPRVWGKPRKGGLRRAAQKGKEGRAMGGSAAKGEAGPRRGEARRKERGRAQGGRSGAKGAGRARGKRLHPLRRYVLLWSQGGVSNVLPNRPPSLEAVPRETHPSRNHPVSHARRGSNPFLIDLARRSEPSGHSVIFPHWWKTFFHCMENRRKVFPLRGKSPAPSVK